MSSECVNYGMMSLTCTIVFLVIIISLFGEKNSSEKIKAFLYSCITSFFATSFDAAGTLIIGFHPDLAIECFRIVNSFFCLSIYFWCEYALYSLDSRLGTLTRYRILIFTFYAVFFAIYLFGDVFYADEAGLHGTIYSRIFYYLVHFIPFLIGVKAFVRAGKKKHYNSRREYLYIGFFTIILLIPVLLYTLSIEFYCQTAVGAFAFFLIFNSIQKSRISLDPLTGISNRLVLCRRIEKVISCRDFSEYLFMIDANSFKALNDTYGHVEGDNAIMLISDVLKKSVPKSMLVSRYGGDEFALLGSLSSESEAEKIIKKVTENLASRCNSNGKAWTITVSIGYARLESSVETVPDFIALADEKLYDEKRKYHR